MRIRGRRLTLEPIEVWAYENAHRLWEWHIFAHNQFIDDWKGLRTTPARERSIGWLLGLAVGSAMGFFLGRIIS